jgi:hypothetical protein
MKQQISESATSNGQPADSLFLLIRRLANRLADLPICSIR